MTRQIFLWFRNLVSRRQATTQVETSGSGVSRLKVAWRLMQRCYQQAEKDIPWHDDDARALTQFLNTPTGEKLVALLQHQEATQNASAVLHADRIEWSCGFAAGNRANLATIFSYAKASTATEAGEIDEQAVLTAAAGLDNLQP